MQSLVRVSKQTKLLNSLCSRSTQSLFKFPPLVNNHGKLNFANHTNLRKYTTDGSPDGSGIARDPSGVVQVEPNPDKANDFLSSFSVDDFFAASETSQALNPTTPIAFEDLDLSPEISKVLSVASDADLAVNWDTFDLDDAERSLAVETDDIVFRIVTKFFRDRDLTERDMSLLREQVELELLANKRAQERYEKMLNDVKTAGVAAGLSFAQSLQRQWYTPLREAIHQELVAIHQNLRSPDRSIYGPFIKDMKPEALAVVSMNTMLNLLISETEDDGVKFTRAAIALGAAVEAEAHMEYFRKEKPHILKKYESNLHTVKDVHMLARREIDVKWSTVVHAKLGAFLIQTMLDVVKYDGEPALTRFMDWSHPSRQKSVAKIQCSDKFFAHLSKGFNVPETIMNSKMFPMVCSPRPWTDISSGGYYVHKSPLVRAPSRSQLRALRGEVPQPMPSLTPPAIFATTTSGEGVSAEDPIPQQPSPTSLDFSTLVRKPIDLTRLYNALNILASTKWKINTKVFEVMEAAYNAGGDLGELPPVSDQAMPEPPPEDSPQEVTAVYKRERAKIRRSNREMHSLRCDLIYKFEVARMFKDKEIYFPYNMDFRGRTYPIPPHLNHIGSDICRGLLMFAEGKKLGVNGLRWLKIHLANLFGSNKISLDERVQFSDRNLEMIFDSADDPLGGKRFWLTAEDPWQALATCFEIAKAERSGDPGNYETCLPVHQDGSCNGLQHYAALGRDYEGGLHVNLVPAPKPQDIYSGVLEIVKKKVLADAANNMEEAILVNGKIDRKVVKQSVMTSVYGVTALGARQQIKARINERSLVPEDKIDKCAKYLAGLTLSSLGDIFHAATEIMDWLRECARLIAKTDQPVAWTTPLGLPVVQPYRRPGKLMVRTIVQKIVLAEDNDDLPVSNNKQKSAFPPNFIHSLDSTHMLMTAVECKKIGLTFAAVHDSYWTHPSTVEDMSKILRQQFVDLYSQPILENLKAEFEERFPDVDFPDLPARGSLKLESVLDSTYFFH